MVIPSDTQPAARSHFTVNASRGQNGPADKQEGKASSVSVGVRSKGSKLPGGGSSGNALARGSSAGRLSKSNSAASSESAWDAPTATESSGKSLRGKKESASERVRVVLRVRPPVREDEHPGCLEICPDGASVKLYRMGAVIPETRYSFDRVLGPNSTQADVYEAAVAPVIADVMNGYNGTIMAYGQTGAGKTHSLSSIEPDNIGMMPRAAAEVFVQANSDPYHDYVVLMSYVQIYMELIQDLLRPESENLVIRENESGVFISGVQEVQVKKMEDCLQLLQLGERNRAFAFTQLNAHSSRSHAIVLMTVLKRKKPSAGSPSSHADAKVRVGKLFIVDLAGSERLKKSKSEGQRQREASSINRSLTNLGMCINARADPNSQHVPFRDSKLTRLLQESLGGNAKTSLVLAAADVREHAEETQQTLQFGSRAMCVKTHPVVNEQIDFKALHAEVLMQLDSRQDTTNMLEATLLAKDEEMAKLQEAMRQEQEQNLAIMRALEKEKQELHEIRQREAEQVEVMLQQKQVEIEKHQSELQSSVAELEHRDKELSDREARLEELFHTVQDRDALLREFSDEKERLTRELQIAKVEAQRSQVKHDQETETLLRQWHAEKGARTKQLRRAEAETRELAARQREEKAELGAEIERMREGQQALVLQWRAEVGAVASLLSRASSGIAAMVESDAKTQGDDSLGARPEGSASAAKGRAAWAGMADTARALEEALKNGWSGVLAAEEATEGEVSASVWLDRTESVRLALKASFDAIYAATGPPQQPLGPGEAADPSEPAIGEKGLKSEAGANSQELAAELELTRAKLEASETELAKSLATIEGLREQLATTEADAEEALKGLSEVQDRWELELTAARADADAARADGKAEREALVRRWQEERGALEKQLASAERVAKEQPFEFELRYESLMREVEEQRKTYGHTVANLRTKLHAAEEAREQSRAAASREIQEALAREEVRQAQRSQRTEELAERKRKRELKAAEQRREAELEELRAKLVAEARSLSAQLETAMAERETAASAAELSERHAKEISALKNDFKAEMAMAREAWARQHNDAVAELRSGHEDELRRVQDAAAERERSLETRAAAEAAEGRKSFALKLTEQHRQLAGATEVSVNQERTQWEARLAEAGRAAAKQQSLADAALAAEREKVKGLAAKHQFAIQALKKHHKAELSRVQEMLADSHAKDLSTHARSFQSELSNVSQSFQAEGSELASQISSLRAGMAEASRAAAAERERLLASWEHQQEIVTSLRTEKDDLTARLHASETEVYNAKLQVETIKQKLEMETQRLAAEAELLKERMGNQAALERDALAHKHQLELQTIQDTLRQSDQKYASLQQEATVQRQQLAAEVADLQAKLSEVQAEATSTQRRLEALVEEAQSSLSTLQVEHQEMLVEKGLLIGSNKSLQERVESLVKVMEEQQALAEERVTGLEKDRKSKQGEHEHQVSELSRKIREMEQDMSQKQMAQEDNARRNGSASVIQRAFRRKKLTALVGAKAQTEEQLESTRRKAEELENHRMLLEAQRISGMALTGRQLVQHTSAVAQASVSELLTAFLIPKRDLDKIEKANRTRERFTTGQQGDGSTPISRTSLGGATPKSSSAGPSFARRISFGGGAGSNYNAPPLSPRLDMAALSMSATFTSPRDSHAAMPPAPPATSVSVSTGGASSIAS